MKVKLEFFKCMGIMLANLCHPYILSTTVLSDNPVDSMDCIQSDTPDVTGKKIKVTRLTGERECVCQRSKECVLCRYSADTGYGRHDWSNHC